MAEKKTTAAAKAEEAVKEVKAAAEKTGEAVKSTAKKAVKTAETAVKTAAKATKEKKETVKKAAAKKTAEKKEAKDEVILQLSGKEDINVAAILEAAKADYKAKGHRCPKNVTVYVKPEEGVAYYTVNGVGADDYKVEL